MIGKPHAGFFIEDIGGIDTGFAQRVDLLDQRPHLGEQCLGRVATAVQPGGPVRGRTLQFLLQSDMPSRVLSASMAIAATWTREASSRASPADAARRTEGAGSR